MENCKIEIGQKVTWRAGRDNCFILEGLYLKPIDKELSEVICTHRNRVQYQVKMEVLTKIIEVI